MELDNWFPCPIARETHPDWQRRMDPIVESLINNPDSTINTSFYHNGSTTYGTRNLAYEPTLQPFVEFVQGKAREFLDLQGYDSDRVAWRPYFFANSFLEGSNHPKHLHSGCSISGIFYLRTPEGSSDIIFYPNQPFKDFFDYMYAVKQETWYSMPSVKYTPQPGLLLMWPAWLYHEVPPNRSKTPRTSIVFNL